MKLHYQSLLLPILLVFALKSVAQTNLTTLFQDPPDEAKPRGYWLWAHGNFDYSRITEELTQFKEMGLGGVDIYDMGLADPYDMIPEGNSFLGPAMMDGIAFALQQAQELNLRMGLSVSNGWNAGADWIQPDEMIMRLLFWSDTIQGPMRLKEIGFPEVPTTFKKPYGTFELFPQFREDGYPVYYEDVGLFALPVRSQFKEQDIILFDPSEINGGQVDLEVPAGKWIIMRAAVTPLGQRMWMRSDKSDGFIMDHYSKQATKHHFEEVIGRLEERLGDLSQTSLERLYLASFEAEDYVIWSPRLADEFFSHHGYEIGQYLPILAGIHTGDDETEKRFLHDYRSTVSEMFVNNHYRQARSISNAHGVLLASESGGPGPPLHYVPTEDLKALGSVDVMRGEFWNKPSELLDQHGNDLLQVVKNIASASHIYGSDIVEMESFTSHRKHWEESPIELKKLADKAFCQGMNRLVYHTMPHSPKEAGVPGWSYQAGTHISPKMSWWKLSKPFHQYMARTSALLQQGLFVADVAYYYGERIPNFASGSKYVRETLGPGYDYDDLNKEVLLQSTVNHEGKLLLPSGMSYHLLVLPDDQGMSLEVLEKIEELLQKGATILGPKPTQVPGLKDFQAKETQLLEIADKVWGKGKSKKEQSYGKGTVFNGVSEKDILSKMNVFPDFQVYESANANLQYIHRKTQKEDIYFISNPDSNQVNVAVGLRAEGKQPYLFDPTNGDVLPLALYFNTQGITKVPILLQPYGSVFIVFDGKGIGNNVVQVRENGSTTFPDSGTGLKIEYDELGALVLQTRQPGNYRLQFSDGTEKELNVAQIDNSIELSGPWDVYFPYGWGFDPIQTFEELTDWTAHFDPELSIFSGIATYKKSFSMSGIYLTESSDFMLDLGKVGEVARVYLNGHELGTSVFAPHFFLLKDELRDGQNNLVIEIGNTWLNQLAGESNKPLKQQRTRSNLGSRKNQNARPWSEKTPQPSGLIGPVLLKPVQTIRL